MSLKKNQYQKRMNRFLIFDFKWTKSENVLFLLGNHIVKMFQNLVTIDTNTLCRSFSLEKANSGTEYPQLSVSIVSIKLTNRMSICHS